MSGGSSSLAVPLARVQRELGALARGGVLGPGQPLQRLRRDLLALGRPGGAAQLASVGLPDSDRLTSLGHVRPPMRGASCVCNTARMLTLLRNIARFPGRLLIHGINQARRNNGAPPLTALGRGA